MYGRASVGAGASQRAGSQDRVRNAYSHSPLSVLGAARLAGRLHPPLVGVVTDFTAHAFWSEPGVDQYCVAPGSAALDLARHGTPRCDIVETGIPVRSALANIPPVPDGPLADPLQVLVTSGGFGIGPLEAAIGSFAGRRGMRLTVVCGASRKRHEQARAAAIRAGVAAWVIGYERNMPARLAEAQLVLGKPGGLTSSEALAAGRPMALMGVCPGQEQHNADWLCLNGAAVAVDPAHAGSHIELLARSGRLRTMAAAARRLGTPRAATAVLEVAQGLARRAPNAA